jgi:hypothetical protein
MVFNSLKEREEEYRQCIATDGIVVALLHGQSPPLRLIALFHGRSPPRGARDSRILHFFMAEARLAAQMMHSFYGVRFGSFLDQFSCV